MELLDWLWQYFSGQSL
jgi:hypothetical protein